MRKIIELFTPNWGTSDGQVWEVKKEAILHQCGLDLTKLVDKAGHIISERSASAFILDNAHEIAEITAEFVAADTRVGEPQNTCDDGPVGGSPDPTADDYLAYVDQQTIADMAGWQWASGSLGQARTFDGGAWVPMRVYVHKYRLKETDHG